MQSLACAREVLVETMLTQKGSWLDSEKTRFDCFLIISPQDLKEKKFVSMKLLVYNHNPYGIGYTDIVEVMPV